MFLSSNFLIALLSKTSLLVLVKIEGTTEISLDGCEVTTHLNVTTSPTRALRV